MTTLVGTFRTPFFRRFVITNDSIIYKGLIDYNYLKFSEIKGYRKDEQGAIKIVPENKDIEDISIGVATERYSEIFEWISTTFRNLNAEETESDVKEGVRVQKIRTLITCLNGIALVAGLWLIFNRHPLLVAVCLVIPIVGFAVARWHYGNSKAILPSTTLAFFLAGYAMVGALRERCGFPRYEDYLLPMALTTLAIVALRLLVERRFKIKSFANVIGFLIDFCLTGFFSYFLVLAFDCFLLT